MDAIVLPGERNDFQFALRYPLRILIADDHEISRRLTLLMLRNLGYEADARANGQQCYQAAVGYPYDLVITDLDMPEMTGLECTRALKVAGVNCSIVALTASAPETARIDCLRAGMVGFLRKPVSLPELKRTLREVSMRKWLNDANVTTHQHG